MTEKGSVHESKISKSMVAIPLTDEKGSQIGVLYINYQEPIIPLYEIEAIRQFAELAAIALERVGWKGNLPNFPRLTDDP